MKDVNNHNNNNNVQRHRWSSGGDDSGLTEEERLAKHLNAMAEDINVAEEMVRNLNKAEGTSKPPAKIDVDPFAESIDAEAKLRKTIIEKGDGATGNEAAMRKSPNKKAKAKAKAEAKSKADQAKEKARKKRGSTRTDMEVGMFNDIDGVQATDDSGLTEEQRLAKHLNAMAEDSNVAEEMVRNLNKAGGTSKPPAKIDVDPFAVDGTATYEALQEEVKVIAEENAAASTLQAAIRGKTVRINIANSITLLQNCKPCIEGNLCEELPKKRQSAAKLQSLHRGNTARKQATQNKKAAAKLKPYRGGMQYGKSHKGKVAASSCRPCIEAGL